MPEATLPVVETGQQKEKPTQVKKIKAKEEGSKENPLSAKFRQVRDDAKDRVQRITLLSQRTEFEGSPKAIDLQEISNPNLTPVETIMKCDDLASRSTDYIQQAKNQRELMVTDYRATAIQIEDIDHKLARLPKGMMGVTKALERRHLLKQKVGLELHAESLKAKIESAKQQEQKAQEAQKLATEKRDQILGQLAVEEVKTIRDAYEKFLDEALEDPTLSNEIIDAYVTGNIQPLLEEKMRENPDVTPETIEQFRTLFGNVLEHRFDPSFNEHNDKLNEFISDSGLYGLRDYCVDLLVLDNDKAVVQRVVAKIAASDIKTIEDAVLKSMDYRSRWELRYAVRGADKKGPYGHSGGNDANESFGRKVEFEMTDEGRLHYMPFWEALKSSPSAVEIFGDFIQMQDNEVFATVLNKSLRDNDGRYIDMLSHYQKPEAVRNLLIIAAADNKTYRTIHANAGLARLARRPDWSQILDETVELYPALSAVRPILETWTYEEYGSVDGIQEATKDFSLSLINDTMLPTELKNLAMEAIPSDTILDILVKKGTLARSDADTLIQCQQTLNEMIEEQVIKIARGEVDSKLGLSDSALRRHIRQTLVKFNLSSPETSGNENEIAALRRLSKLSGKILESKGDVVFLKFLLREEIVEVIATKSISPELIFAFPSQVKVLMGTEMEGLRSFILQNAEVLLHDSTDLNFLNRLIGEFGKKSDTLIKGYKECLEKGIIKTKDKELALEFARQFKVFSPTTLGGYIEAKKGGYEGVYVAQLSALADKLTGSGLVTDEERNKPYYKDLMLHVYAHNSGAWTSFDKNRSCQDRSADLAEYKIRPRYEIDLLSQSEIKIKASEALDPQAQEDVKKPIFSVSEKIKNMEYDNEKVKAELSDSIDKRLQEIIAKGGLAGVSMDSLKTPEEKLFLILTDSIYGIQVVDKNVLKDLLITYEFANFEDIKDYIAGTTDRVSRASNKDYALLCEVNSFYSDRIKEVNRRLVQAAWENPQIAAIMPDYFRKLAADTSASQREERINKLQVGRLGMSDSFIKQLQRLLEKKGRRKYDPSEVREIVRRYEALTGGLQEKASTSPKPETRAFYGQLRSQREKTFEALKIVAGQEIDPSKVFLDEINLQQITDTETSIKEGKYNPEQFASYTVQRFIDLFDEEKTRIDGELAKFESLSGKKREVLYGYISKTKETAHARMVGGVCVSGDNPYRGPQNMWDMPNYFQFVLQEPDTKECQGLVLLHSFTQDGKKILSASFNPSSTYLYSVDEADLFKGLEGTVEQFAQENGFDLVVSSRNKTIRTNRTGGEFEKAFDKRVAQVNKTFTFNSPQQFSYYPVYQLKDMDVLWERPTVS